MSSIIVLKFGSSVLRSPADLHLAVEEIYRRWREGKRVLAVVSAFEGITDRLFAEAADAIGADCPQATAGYVATGEQQTATLLMGSLQRHGIPSRAIEPLEIQLSATGTPLSSTPVQVSKSTLHHLWTSDPILILPGFYGVDEGGRTVLFGRGGSDLSAIFLAAQLDAECRLYKDVPGVFDSDPAQSSTANRYERLSWATAARIAGQLIQPQALQFARSRHLTFDVQRPNESHGTQVGASSDHCGIELSPRNPLRVALAGYGTVGRGVHALMECHSDLFTVQHILVRQPDRHAGIKNLTSSPSVITGEDVDVVVICTSHNAEAPSLIESALKTGKFVVTANKAAIAELGSALVPYLQEPQRLLWYSAAVGGALPVLETLSGLPSRVREVRGIVNGTCGVVLEEWASGRTFDQAIVTAQSAGFAEADPTRDISGRDSADKLALIAHAAFGLWLRPEDIPTIGIESIQRPTAGYKLIARVRLEGSALVASVKPERPEPNSFLGDTRGAENRVEIELTSGELVRLRGQGAGCWPTAGSVMADLLEIARKVTAASTAESRNAPRSRPVDREDGDSLASAGSVASSDRRDVYGSAITLESTQGRCCQTSQSRPGQRTDSRSTGNVRHPRR
jgi:homoserine dehydrogenase